MSSDLEWSKRANYAVTELVLFLLASLILFVMIVFSFMYSYLQTNSHNKEDKKVSFFSTLRPLFENVFPTAVAFTPANKETKEGKGRTESNHAEAQGKKKTLRVNIVFLGHEEPPERETKTSLVRIWVYVYFICLCGLVILWAVSIFSDSVLYRKISSCNDISVKDTDMTCFLLSNEDIPEGIQEIIDEENSENKAELVPCAKVQKYIDTNNLTYDLEVICYQYQLNPIAAIGVSYGAMKSIAFAIVSVLSFIFAFVNKLFGREPKNKKKQNNLEDNVQKCSRKKIPTSYIVLFHVFFFIVSLAIIAIFAIVVAVIHEVTGFKDSGYDFLRGEKFYSYSVVVLIPITIVYLSFVPWWALEPLEEPKEWDIDFRSEDKVAIRNKMNRFVHRALLHQKFSTPLTIMFDIINRALSQPTNGSNKATSPPTQGSNKAMDPPTQGTNQTEDPPTEGSNKDKTEGEGSGVTSGDVAVQMTEM